MRSFLAACLLAPVAAGAALVDRGGGLIYDDTFNLTWMQDWSNGQGTQQQAVLWADALTFGGFDDWRLPTAQERALATNICQGFPCDLTELGHLYWTELGNSLYNFNNPGPFTIPSGYYWTSTKASTTSGYAFEFSRGTIDIANNADQYYFVAVRYGDVAQVPETSTILLALLAGLTAIGLRRRYMIHQR